MVNYIVDNIEDIENMVDDIAHNIDNIANKVENIANKIDDIEIRWTRVQRRATSSTGVHTRCARASPPPAAQKFPVRNPNRPMSVSKVNRCEP